MKDNEAVVAGQNNSTPTARQQYSDTATQRQQQSAVSSQQSTTAAPAPTPTPTPTPPTTAARQQDSSTATTKILQGRDRSTAVCTECFTSNGLLVSMVVSSPSASKCVSTLWLFRSNRLIAVAAVACAVIGVLSCSCGAAMWSAELLLCCTMWRAELLVCCTMWRAELLLCCTMMHAVELLECRVAVVLYDDA